MRVHEEPQRVPGRRALRRTAGTDAPHRGADTALTETGRQAAVVGTAFELHVDDSIERDCRRAVRLDEDARVAHVLGRHRREPDGPGRVLPGQTGRESDLLPLGTAPGRAGEGWEARRCHAQPLTNFHTVAGNDCLSVQFRRIDGIYGTIQDITRLKFLTPAGYQVST